MVAATHGDLPLREAVAVFDREDELRYAMYELRRSGFDQTVFSVMSRLAAAEILPELSGDCPDCPRLLRLTGVGKRIDMGSVGIARGALIGAPLYACAMAAMIGAASNGAELVTVAVAGIGGGAVGAVLGSRLLARTKQWHERRNRGRIDHGGSVLWIHIQNEEHEARVKRILSRHPAHAVHVHGAPI